MYESHYVFQFARLWGAKEGALGISSDNVLLGNSQNPLDALLGDVVGKTGCRFFLIEFKRERAGLAAEVHATSGKPHRASLYQHLRDDHTCRMLARFGHFGAYADETGTLQFEPYAHGVAPVQSHPEIVKKVLFGEPMHELDARSFVAQFDKFYDDVTNPSTLPFAQDDKFYANGLGLPEAAFKEYIECMFQHLEHGKSDGGQCGLIVFDTETKKTRIVIESVEVLAANVHAYFKRLAATMTQEEAPRRKMT